MGLCFCFIVNVLFYFYSQEFAEKLKLLSWDLNLVKQVGTFQSLFDKTQEYPSTSNVCSAVIIMADAKKQKPIGHQF